MLLQYSQGKSPNLSKNRCRINIPVVAQGCERNIQTISQCYAGKDLLYTFIVTYFHMLVQNIYPLKINRKFIISWYGREVSSIRIQTLLRKYLVSSIQIHFKVSMPSFNCILVGLFLQKFQSFFTVLRINWHIRIFSAGKPVSIVPLSFYETTLSSFNIAESLGSIGNSWLKKY